MSSSTQRLSDARVLCALTDVRGRIAELIKELEDYALDSSYTRGMIQGLKEADVMLHLEAGHADEQ